MIPPNILYIHSHDTGRHLQPYGFPVATPNLQSLADRGVIFRQAFCAAPTCSPSRAAIMTGLCPHSAGMLGLAHRGFSMQDYSKHLTHTLKAAGYFTALFGIQHIAQGPEVIGYDLLRAQGINGVEIAHSAADFFANPAQKPFFASIGFFETHRPFAEGGEKEAEYSNSVGRLPDTPSVRGDVANFYASVRKLDKQVGVVLYALKASGLEENTLVIFTTDHGIAFPGHKCTLSDGGIGVALVMAGVGGFSGGRVMDALVSQLDLFPTLTQLIGCPAPVWLQGQSLLPLMQGQTEQINQAVFSEVNYHAAYEPQRAVRTARWKYIRRFDDRSTPVLANCDDSPSKEEWLRQGWQEIIQHRECLYDLAFDPLETNNLAEDPARSGILIELRTRLLSWMTETQDPLLRGPILAPVGAKVNSPDALSPSEPPL